MTAILCNTMSLSAFDLQNETLSSDKGTFQSDRAPA